MPLETGRKLNVHKSCVKGNCNMKIPNNVFGKGQDYNAAMSRQKNKRARAKC